MFMLLIALLPLLVLNASGEKSQVSSTLDGRIVGGKDADITDYPYQVAMIFMGSQYCGGAIISPTWVITAAHCVYDRTIKIRVGSSQAETGGTLFEISRKIIHPNYNSTITDYDIGLLELTSEIPSINGSAVTLPDVDNVDVDVPEGTTVTVTGWGDVDEDSNVPDILQMVEVPVVDHEACRSAYVGVKNAIVTDQMFCAGFLGVGGKDACSGDSGGPVTVDGILYGLVSWGKGCAEPQYPGVYTNVLVFRSWIKEITGL